MMKPEQRPNADDTREPENASPRRVPLNAMLERGGAANDGHEKNETLGTATVFQTLNRITVPEPFTVEQRPEQALSDAAKKDPCCQRHRPKRTDTAGGSFSATKLTCARKK